MEEKHYKTAIREIRRMEESIARFRQFNREKSIRAAESKEKALEKIKEQLEVPEAERGQPALWLHRASTRAATTLSGRRSWPWAFRGRAAL